MTWCLMKKWDAIFLGTDERLLVGILKRMTHTKGDRVIC